MKNKKAKKYNGRRVRTIYKYYDLVEADDDFSDEEKAGFIQEYNIIEDLEKFRDKQDYADNNNVELLKDNLILYYCDVRRPYDLASLCDLRQRWYHGMFNYREFLTKEEIKKLLEDDYLVAVEGLQEIDLNDLDFLED